MEPIFKKLNYKAQPEILVLNAPDSFQHTMKAMEKLTSVREKIAGVKSIEFVLAFVTKQKEIDALMPKLDPLLQGDALLWFVYPKGTSKRYTCDFNRDTGWQIVGDHGFESVRMVAIDEDWSALRFRRNEYVKVMTRSSKMALSAEGKKRVTKK